MNRYAARIGTAVGFCFLALLSASVTAIDPPNPTDDEVTLLGLEMRGPRAPYKPDIAAHQELILTMLNGSEPRLTVMAYAGVQAISHPLISSQYRGSQSVVRLTFDPDLQPERWWFSSNEAFLDFLSALFLRTLDQFQAEDDALNCSADIDLDWIIRWQGPEPLCLCVAQSISSQFCRPALARVMVVDWNDSIFMTAHREPDRGTVKTFWYPLQASPDGSSPGAYQTIWIALKLMQQVFPVSPETLLSHNIELVVMSDLWGTRVGFKETPEGEVELNVSWIFWKP